MKKQSNKKFKRGVASFYIVAFSTLILTVVATSFATVILSEVTRTSNDDLSQSAYDSALSGTEDAKLAYSNYLRCKARGGAVATEPDGSEPITCGEIIWWMEHPDCDMVGHILGRIPEKQSGEIVLSDTLGEVIEETSVTNQAYTCVTITTALTDYRANLTSANQMRTVKIGGFSTAQGATVAAKNIRAIRLSWYEVREDTPFYYSNFVNNGSSWQAAFQPVKSAAVASPPTVEVQLIQTAQNFSLSDFDIANNGRTDRATVYLVPTDQWSMARGTDAKLSNGVFDSHENNTSGTYIGVWNGTSEKRDSGENFVSAAQVAKTNDHQVKNLPYVVYCPNETADFACSAEIELPEPVGGERSDETFMFVISLPYGQPDTDFMIEFLCRDEANCGERKVATIRDMQVLIDSTGRANDLYRRVETRLETSDTSFAYPEYAVQILNDGSGGTINKSMTVTKECVFYDDGGSNC